MPSFLIKTETLYSKSPTIWMLWKRKNSSRSSVSFCLPKFYDSNGVLFGSLKTPERSTTNEWDWSLSNSYCMGFWKAYFWIFVVFVVITMVTLYASWEEISYWLVYRWGGIKMAIMKIPYFLRSSYEFFSFLIWGYRLRKCLYSWFYLSLSFS